MGGGGRGGGGGGGGECQMNQRVGKGGGVVGEGLDPRPRFKSGLTVPVKSLWHWGGHTQRVIPDTVGGVSADTTSRKSGE